MEKIEELKARVKEFPRDPGVYLMKNQAGKVIYVGKAKDLRARVRSYFGKQKDHSLKTKFLVNQIDHIDYMLTKTEVEAYLLEASLIKKHRPRYNIRLKDDKAYPYIRCSISDVYPRLYLARKVQNDGSVYFGPYTSGYAVRETIRFLNRSFKIRDCSDTFFKSRKRPCMTHQIGRCTAPCVDLISAEEYNQDIKAALQFLRGQNKKVIKRLTDKMKEAASEERFEAAAKLRDSIDAVKAILEKQSVVSTKKQLDQDVVAYYGDKRGTLVETLHVRSGRVIGSRSHFMPKFDYQAANNEVKEWLTSFLNQYYVDNIVPDEIILGADLGDDIAKLLQAVFYERQRKRPKIGYATGADAKKLLDLALTNAESHFRDQVNRQEDRMRALEEIQKKLKLPEIPHRIECFDISTFQGKETVASQVVFEEGLPKKDDYRRYKIRDVEGQNDYAAMKEVLTRRFKHTEYDDPHLLLIDGGKGQLKMATEVLKEIHRQEIPVAGIAKARARGEFHQKEIVHTKERFFLPGRQNPVTFANNSEALQILAGVRDEAHRFAITYHRKLRDKAALVSELDDVVGLGEKKKQTLLKKFGSVDNIRTANADDIAALRGFNRILAERILIHLQK